jgi:hypothetical protein
MLLVTNVEKRKKMNWVGIVLNNLYKRLKDMFKPIKSIKVDVSKDFEFVFTKMVAIIFHHWFLIPPNLEIPKTRAK